MDTPHVPALLQQLADGVGGKLEEVSSPLPDGSGFAVMSMPLPKDHWLTQNQEGFNVPPMPFRIGEEDGLKFGRTRQMWADNIEAATRYAVRASTRNGKDNDLDPDALVRNMVVGMLGYWTPTGFSSDEWANPSPAPPEETPPTA